jgi:cell division protein FtsB
VVKPVAKASVKKAPVSKTAKAVAKLSASIAKLTERKDKINTEIKALRDQRTALKVVPVTSAPVGPKAKVAPKAAAPKKAAKPAAKK